MEFTIHFTAFHDFNESTRSLLDFTFPILKHESLDDFDAICWLHNEDSIIIGVALCNHTKGMVSFSKIVCTDEYDEKPFLLLITKWFKNRVHICMISSDEFQYKRFSGMLFPSSYMPLRCYLVYPSFSVLPPIPEEPVTELHQVVEPIQDDELISELSVLESRPDTIKPEPESNTRCVTPDNTTEIIVIDDDDDVVEPAPKKLKTTHGCADVYCSPYKTLEGKVVGRGVIATRKIEKDEKVCEFPGKKIKFSESHLYNSRIRLSKNYVLGCDVPITDIVTMVNTANGLVCPTTGRILSNRDNNCKLVIEKNTAYISTTRNINKDEELFFPYYVKY